MTHLVLEHLRYIRTKIDSVDERVGRIEVRLSSVEGHLGNLLVSKANQNAELDKIGRRLDTGSSIAWSFRRADPLRR